MTPINVRQILPLAMAALLASSLVALPRRALACGGGGVTSQSGGVVANAQRIFVSVRAATTDVVVQIGVPANTAAYGALIPTPEMPTLDPTPVSESDLSSLDQATRPSVYVSEPASDEGCGCPVVAGSSGGTKSGDGMNRGPAVGGPVNIGPVEAVVLRGDDPGALNAWLASNGFVLDGDGTALIASYAGTGRYFIAIKRSDTASSGAPSSIGLHYTLPGAHQSLSLRFARLGAAPSVAFTLFNVTRGPSAPSTPFVPLVLNDLDKAMLRVGHYSEALAAAVASRSHQAFVLEGTSFKSTLQGRNVSASLLVLIDEDATVTRMTTIVPATALTQDATFGPYAGVVFDSVYLTQVVRTVGYSSAGMFLALLGWPLWRRRRSPR